MRLCYNHLFILLLFLCGLVTAEPQLEEIEDGIVNRDRLIESLREHQRHGDSEVEHLEGLDKVGQRRQSVNIPTRLDDNDLRNVPEQKLLENIQDHLTKIENDVNAISEERAFHERTKRLCKGAEHLREHSNPSHDGYEGLQRLGEQMMECCQMSDHKNQQLCQESAMRSDGDDAVCKYLTSAIIEDQGPRLAEVYNQCCDFPDNQRPDCLLWMLSGRKWSLDMFEVDPGKRIFGRLFNYINGAILNSGNPQRRLAFLDRTIQRARGYANNLLTQNDRDIGNSVNGNDAWWVKWQWLDIPSVEQVATRLLNRRVQRAEQQVRSLTSRLTSILVRDSAQNAGKGDTETEWQQAGRNVESRGGGARRFGSARAGGKGARLSGGGGRSGGTVSRGGTGSTGGTGRTGRRFTGGSRGTGRTAGRFTGGSRGTGRTGGKGPGGSGGTGGPGGGGGSGGTGGTGGKGPGGSGGTGGPGGGGGSGGRGLGRSGGAGRTEGRGGGGSGGTGSTGRRGSGRSGGTGPAEGTSGGRSRWAGGTRNAGARTNWQNSRNARRRGNGEENPSNSRNMDPEEVSTRHMENLCIRVARNQGIEVVKEEQRTWLPDASEEELSLWSETVVDRQNAARNCCSQEPDQQSECMEQARYQQYDQACDQGIDLLPPSAVEPTFLDSLNGECCALTNAERYNCFDSDEIREKHLDIALAEPDISTSTLEPLPPTTIF